MSLPVKKITLKNFQSHKSTEIIFERITTLVGKNSHGKTAILRAIKLLCKSGNWPDSWITDGETSASIEGEFDSCGVIREKTSKSQKTILKKDDEIIPFVGKKDATPFILEALGFNKVALDEASGPEEFNFIEVFDRPYFIEGRSDVNLRKLSGILGINVVEDAKNRLSKKLDVLERDFVDINEKRELLSERILKYEGFLEKNNSILNDCQQLYKNWTEKKNLLDELNDIRNEYHKLSNYITKDKLKEFRKSLEEIKFLVSHYVMKESYLNTLDEINEDLKELHCQCSDLMDDKIFLDFELIGLKQKLNEIEVCPTCGKPL